VVLLEALTCLGWTDSTLRLLRVSEGFPSKKGATRDRVTSRSRGWPNLDEEILLAGIVRFLPFIIRQCQLTLLPRFK
jgi:hypothetical protein